MATHVPDDKPISVLNYLERVFQERARLSSERFRTLKLLIDERNRQYDRRFHAAELAVGAALAAQDKLVTNAFGASEKAVLKAEQAQKEYNERSNEFRAQLDDQAKTLMPRPETLNMFKALEEKVTGVQNVMESKISNVQANAKSELNAAITAFDKGITANSSDIDSLRESRSEVGGRSRAEHDYMSNKQWSTGIMVAIALGIVGAVVSIVTALMHAWK